MNHITSKENSFDTLNVTKVLLLLITALVLSLSIKAVYDLIKDFDVFPVWFVPGFGFGVLVLNILSLYFTFQVWKMEYPPLLLSDKQSIALWILIPFSYVCVTSVHAFYPFRLNVLSIIPRVNMVMKVNYTVVVFGLITSILLAGIYISGRIKPKIVAGLLVMALLTLIPNDNCANPFNYWWIETIGASPLMYTPNVFAVIFATCGFYGVRPRSATALIICICVGSFMLGMGHRLRIIW
ncbi:hypothetical protein ANAEL_05151 [Anaerolineales bacterium]|nr:hypothetical protein ANAEL_05151 [Anaerolineales bacterium]